jgi:hypothetical protein
LGSSVKSEDKSNPIIVTIKPTIKQFFANFESVFLKIKYDATPPMTLKNIGTRYHHLLFELDDFPDE